MKFLSSKEYNAKLRITVQSSGRLSFTNETARILNMAGVKKIRMAQDDDDPQMLFFIIPQNPDDDCYDVKTSGRYYYVATRNLFNSLGLTYKRDSRKGGLCYDLVRDSSLDGDGEGTVYRMIRVNRNNEKEKE